MFILSRVELPHTPPRHAAATSCRFCKRERERERGGRGLQRKTRLRSCGKLAARPTERPSIEGIYRLQNCFRIEQAGILGCRAMWSGSCFQTFRRNAPPHIQGYMSVNSLTFFSYKPHATHKCKRMGAREIDVCT